MGCFNIKGFYSGLPINEGDDIVLFICHGTTFTHNNIPGGSNEQYSPICFPIYGKCDGYGRLCDMKRDANTERLEELYGDSVDKLLYSINENCGKTADSTVGDTKYSSFLEKISDNHIKNFVRGLYYVMERLDVYEKLIEIYNPPVIRMNRGNSLNMDIGEYWLKRLGFVKDDERNIYKYKDKDCLFHVESDGSNAQIMIGDKNLYSVYDKGIGNFVDKWNTVSPYTIDIPEDIMTLPYFDIVWKETVRKFFDPERDTTYRYSIDSVYDDMPLMYEDVLSIPYNSPMFIFTEDEDLLRDELKDNICDFYKFNNALTMSCGRYCLSYYGDQRIFDKERIQCFKELYSGYVDILNNIPTEDNEEE